MSGKGNFVVTERYLFLGTKKKRRDAHPNLRRLAKIFSTLGTCRDVPPAAFLAIMCESFCMALPDVWDSATMFADVDVPDLQNR